MADEPLILAIDDAQAQRWFGQLLERSNDLSGLMADIGETTVESTQHRFDQGVAPDGQPWAELADGSGRSPLLDTRRMRDGIFTEHGPDWVETSSDAKQARWHQEGTRPYVILAKPGKALAWPGMRTRTGKNGAEVPGYVKKVNHPGLPARPFVGLSQEDELAIDDLVAAWLDPATDGA